MNLTARAVGAWPWKLPSFRTSKIESLLSLVGRQLLKLSMECSFLEHKVDPVRLVLGDDLAIKESFLMIVPWTRGVSMAYQGLACIFLYALSERWRLDALSLFYRGV